MFWRIILCAITLSQLTSALAVSPQGDADQPARSKGGAMFKWSEVHPDDVGDVIIPYDMTGLRPIARAPLPGIHPRIFFGPDQLPEIRARLKNTVAGREAWLNMLAWVNAMKGPYDANAPYANPKRVNNRYRVPLFRSVGGNLERVGQDFNKLLAGDMSVDPGFHWSVFPLEAFRCLIEDDSDAAGELLTVLETAVKGGQQRRASAAKEIDRLHPYKPIGEHNLALCYDLLYNWMTPSQRDLFRQELVLATNFHANYGSFEAANATTSNWCTLDSFMPVTLLSIEGEEGFNELKYKATVRAWKNFLTYGWYKSGEGYEGRGKNYQFNDTMIAFAMRGDNLAAHPHVRVYGENLLFHAMQPYRGSFFGHDLWGGTDRLTKLPPARGKWLPNIQDVIGLKYLFPNSKKIDWVYRNVVGEDYSGLPDRPDGYNNALLSSLIFASDFDPANDDPAKIADGLSFFCGERGLMITRSDWSSDAVMLSMHTRQDLGGHTCADRNSFILTGAGRIWARMDTHNFSNFTNSVVIIDNQEQEQSVPAKVVDYRDTPNLTSMTGDSKYAWDWRWTKAGKSGQYTAHDAATADIPAGWEKVLETPNDFRYVKGLSPYLSKPFFLKDDWLQSGKVTAYIKQKNYPVNKAYRTSSLIRGKHSYVVIIDDIQKDDASRHFDWLMQIPSDVGIVKSTDADLLLSGNTNADSSRPTVAPQKGDAMLLVRLLQAGGASASVARIDQEIFFKTKLKTEKPPASEKNKVKTLVIPADAVSPAFKILLFPHHQGDEIPNTVWNADKTKARVVWSDQVDELSFPVLPNGGIHLELDRQK